MSKDKPETKTPEKPKVETTASLEEARLRWKRKATEERKAAKKSRAWSVGQFLAFGVGLVGTVVAAGLFISPFSVLGVGLGSFSLPLLGGSLSVVGATLGAIGGLLAAKFSGLTSKIMHNGKEASRHNQEAVKASKQAKALGVEQEKIKETARLREIEEVKSKAEAAVKAEQEQKAKEATVKKDVLAQAKKEADTIATPPAPDASPIPPAPPFPPSLLVGGTNVDPARVPALSK